MFRSLARAGVVAALSIVLSRWALAIEPEWSTMRVPGVWEEAPGSPAKSYDGVAWYRCLVHVPSVWDGGAIVLRVEQVDNVHEVYVNGKRVGGRGSFPPRYRNGLGQSGMYRLARVVAGEVLFIAIRVYDHEGRGGFKGEAPCLIHGEAAIVLEGPWQFAMGDNPGFAKPDDLFRRAPEYCHIGDVSRSSEVSVPRRAHENLESPDDLAIDLIAHEPEIVQPVFLNFDERGRMWVVEYAQYPHPAGLRIVSRDNYWRNVYDRVPKPPPHHEPGLDRISIHEDTDGDGSFDTHKIFVDQLNMATSVTVGRGGVWVLNPPYLLFYPDRDRDDVPDSDPVVHLRGFGLEDSHSIANSLRWGPDGWLYGAQGSTVSADIVVDGAPDAKPIHTVGQLIWRYEPAQRRFEVWAEGGGNAFGCEIDSKGRIFSGHNGGDTRGFHYPQHAYLRKGFNKHGPLSNPFAFGYFPQMPHHSVARFTHTFEIYEGNALPERYRGRLFGVDPINRNVPVSEITPDGATFRTRDIALAISTPDKTFRPVDIKSGPDGALYVADWCDTQVNHYRNHEGQIDKTNGRIYRIRARRHDPAGSFDLASLSSTRLVELLRHPNRWHRQTARRLLGDRADRSIVGLLERHLFDTKTPEALEYLWALNLSGGFDESVGRRALEHSDPYVRLWAVRLLCDRTSLSRSSIVTLGRLAAREEHVEVRSQLASSAKRLSVRSFDVQSILAGLLGRDVDADDRYLPLQVWWAIEALCSQHPGKVHALFSDSEIWKSRLVEEHIATRLMRRFAAAGSVEDLSFCARLLEAAPDAASRALLLRGFEQAFDGRPLGDLSPRLVEALRKAGGGSLELRVRQKDAEAIRLALARIADEKTKEVDRLRLIDTFGQIALGESRDVLLTLVGSSGSSRVRQATLAALARFESPAIAESVLRSYADLDALSRRAALDLLATRATWTASLLDAAAADRIDRESISRETIRRLGLHPDQALRARVASVFGNQIVADSAALETRMAELRRVVSTGNGDPYAGQKLFRKTCVRCHYLFNEGGRLGPDLTAYQRQDLDALLLAIVQPSAEIREGFENHTAVTRDGRVMSGLVTDRTDRHVSLQTAEADARPVVLPRSEIVELRVESSSLMPQGLLRGWSESDTRDLFAYLRSTQPLNN